MPNAPAADDVEVLEVRLKAVLDGEIDDEDFFSYSVLVREKGAREDIDLMFDYSFIDDRNGNRDQGELRIAETHVIDARHIDVVATSRSLVLSRSRSRDQDETRAGRRTVTYLVTLNRRWAAV